MPPADAPTPAPSASAPPAPADVYCPRCGYNLRGLPLSPNARCPECGLAVDAALAGKSQIPWTHRREIGRWRAYWRTVRMVVRRPGRFAAEAARPVSYDDARRFRHVTVFLAWVPLAGLMVWGYVATLGEDVRLGSSGPFGMGMLRLGAATPGVTPGGASGGGAGAWATEWAVVAAAAAAVWLFLLAATGAPAYFCRPRRLTTVQQNRAVALSQYGCAALAVTPLGCVLVVLIAVVAPVGFESRGPLFQVIGAAVIVAELFVAAGLLHWYGNTLALVKRGTHSGPARGFAVAVLLPLLWLLQAAAILVGIPAAVAFMGAVVLSFT